MSKSIFKKTHIFPDDIIINILGFIEQNGPMILSYDFKQKKFIDIEHPDYTRAKILVQDNDRSLQSLVYYFKNLDFRFKTEEMCKLIVQNKGIMLKHIRRDLLTEEISKLAVQQNGMSLKHIKGDLLTEEICKLAVQQNGLALRYVRNVRKDLQTYEICILAVQQNGFAIRYVREDLLTREMCKLAGKLAAQENWMCLTIFKKGFTASV
jgi:hypothetical protein